MTGILQVSCGLLIAGAVLAFAVIVSRRSHREPRAAEGPPVSPARRRAAGGTAVPSVTALPEPSAIERRPYETGVLTVEGSS